MGVWCRPVTAAAKLVETAGTCWLIRENTSSIFMGLLALLPKNSWQVSWPPVLVSLHIHIFLKNWAEPPGCAGGRGWSACTNYNTSCKRSLVFYTNSGTLREVLLILALVQSHPESTMAFDGKKSIEKFKYSAFWSWSRSATSSSCFL